MIYGFSLFQIAGVVLMIVFVFVGSHALRRAEIEEIEEIDPLAFEASMSNIGQQRASEKKSFREELRKAKEESEEKDDSFARTILGESFTKAMDDEQDVSSGFFSRFSKRNDSKFDKEFVKYLELKDNDSMYVYFSSNTLSLEMKEKVRDEMPQFASEHPHFFM